MGNTRHATSEETEAFWKRHEAYLAELSRKKVTDTEPLMPGELEALFFHFLRASAKVGKPRWKYVEYLWGVQFGPCSDTVADGHTMSVDPELHSGATLAVRSGAGTFLVRNIPGMPTVTAAPHL